MPRILAVGLPAQPLPQGWSPHDVIEEAHPEKRCDGKVLEAQSDPGLSCAIRIREAGSRPALQIRPPISSCTFVVLKPHTEYGVQTWTNAAAEDGPSARVKMRTHPVGAANNIARFPKRWRGQRQVWEPHSDHHPFTATASRRGQ